MVQTQDHLRWGNFEPWDLCLYKPGKGPVGNATYQILGIWIKKFWRRRFLNIFLSISMFQTQYPQEWSHFGPWDLDLNTLGKGPVDNATFQITSIWAKLFCRIPEYFLCIFMAQTQEPLGCRAILEPGTFVWTNLVKDHQARLQTKFQADETSDFEEEDFLIFFFYVFLWFKPRTPCHRTILDPGPPFEQTW